MQSKWLSQKKVSIWLLIFAGLGMVASLALGYETLEVIKNPSYQPSCNINPVVSCGQVMASPQAEIFGIPNPVFGIIGFSALITLALVLFSGAKLSSRFWFVIGLGALGGVLFSHYLFIVSLTIIGSICPWCSLLWVSTIAIFWAVTTYMAGKGMCDYNTWMTRIAQLWVKYAWPILIVWYLALIMIVFLRFSDFWLSLI